MKMTMRDGDLTRFTSDASFMGCETPFFSMPLSSTVETFSNDYAFLCIVSFLHAHEASSRTCRGAVNPWILDNFDGSVKGPSVHSEERVQHSVEDHSWFDTLECVSLGQGIATTEEFSTSLSEGISHVYQ